MSLAVALAAIRLTGPHGPTRTLVEDVAFTLPKGETLGIVGESGSGKSLVSLAIMGLLPRRLEAEGHVALDGTDLLSLPETRMQDVRGARIGMIFQEPMTALNPAMRIGDQIAEGLRRHRRITGAAARAESLRLIDRVRIPDAARRIDAYPHELSGGQRQRVAIAIALAPGPNVLIADEPTTALDVTVQAEVLALLGELITENGMGLILISHDLGVVASVTARTLVMSGGRVMEQGETGDVLRRPAHPYTRKLLDARPRPDLAVERSIPPQKPGTPPTLEVIGLERSYASRGGHAPFRAVDDVSFSVKPGTIYGIVGESGCGKSTLARIVMALDRPSGGRVLFDGDDLFAKAPRDLLRLRRGFQMVFQDPQGSLDPRQRVGRIVAEPLFLDPAAPRGKARDDLVARALEDVGLSAADAARYPHEFSGGQRQRIAIARAIIVDPKLVVADEPVSALDLSVQAQVLRLILALRDRTGLAVLFISHSLAVVETICDEVGVMQRGRFVETGPARAVFRSPQHPYTRQLIAAEPRFEGPRALHGEGAPVV